MTKLTLRQGVRRLCVCTLGTLAPAVCAFGQATTNAETTLVPNPLVLSAKPAGTAAPGWWNDTIFYEIFVRSFADSDEGPLAGDGIGDIPGLIANLDYLNDGQPPAKSASLGIGGLWLMPIHPSPTYHGYDVLDYTGVNPQYGTVEDVRRLMTEARKRGIKVIIDFVPNHTSSQHPWFLEAADPKSPKHDWYIWSATDPGWRGAWGQKVWHRLKGESETPFYFGMFSSTMPDLNFRNPGPGRAMIEAGRFWLAPENATPPGMGLDGLRLDAIRHLVEDGQVQENVPETYAWLRDFQAAMKKINPSAMTVGEVWSPTEIASGYVTTGAMDLAFEFDLSAGMVEAAKSGTAKPVRDAMEGVSKAWPKNQFGSFLANHDQARVMTQLGGRLDAAKCAAFMMLTGPGAPFIYYGEEIGMTGDKPDENIRTPMQWTRGESAGFTSGKPWREVNSGYELVNVEVQAPESESLYNHYRRLTRLRREEPLLRTGDYHAFMCDHPNVYGFLRTGLVTQKNGEWAVEGLAVVINLGDEPVSNYGLSMAHSPLRPPVVAEIRFGRGMFMNTTVGPQGEMANYRPVHVLRPRTGYVVKLSRE